MLHRKTQNTNKYYMTGAQYKTVCTTTIISLSTGPTALNNNNTYHRTAKNVSATDFTSCIHME